MLRMSFIGRFYSIVSVIRRVLYQRFYCMSLSFVLQMLRNSGGSEEVGTATGSGPVKKSSELQEYRYTNPTKKP